MITTTTTTALLLILIVVLGEGVVPTDAFVVHTRTAATTGTAQATRCFMAPKKKAATKTKAKTTPAAAASPPAPLTTTRTKTPIPATDPTMDHLPTTSHKARPGIDESSLSTTDLSSGGRPGAIIESEEQLARKQEIFEELEIPGSGRDYKDADINMNDYGFLVEELEAEYDIDDPTALDAATLGTWTIRDLQAKFPYEWDPDEGDPDPNQVELQQPGLKFKSSTDVDEEGIEVGYDPMFGPSNPIDTRTIIGAMESYMINDRTKNEAMIPPQFPEGDLEIGYNQDIVQFRKSLDIIETYTDEFLPPDMQIPRHVAKWHGYPEPMSYPHRNETNNRFLEDNKKATDWSKLDPYHARRKAVELARAQNADWLPPGKSQAWHASQRAPYDRVGTAVGSLRPGTIDEELKQRIRPALDVLGSVVELLSMEGGGGSGSAGEEQQLPTVFRFQYYGLMKHRHGMAAWTETLIRDCDVEVTGVVFETGFRRRDYAYDGGDCWYPPSSNVVAD